MRNISILIYFIFQFGRAQNYTEYHTGNSTDVSSNHQSGICLMGGATEHDGAMIWFLNKANGGDVVVLRASGSDGYNDYFYTELGVAINSVTTFVIHNAVGATDPYVLNKIANAEAIWFAGGDQFNYVSYFKDNAMEVALNTFINNKQGVIGGTSAGMAILGNHYFDAENGTVTSAQALNNPYHSNVSLGYNDFLSIPLLEHVITDSHYDDPDRRGRHAVFMARIAQDHGLRPFGIACNEYTAVCVESNGDGYVYGDYPNYEEYAYFLQANCVPDFAPENCTANNPLNWVRGEEAIKAYKVPGTPTGQFYFNIANWQAGGGGSWENWYVSNGNLVTNSAASPDCTLSIGDVSLNNIKVYPNPFTDSITLSSENFDIKMALYNMLGQKVAINKMSTHIETAELTSGLYFLKLQFLGQEQIRTLVKK